MDAEYAHYYTKEVSLMSLFHCLFLYLFHSLFYSLFHTTTTSM